MNNILVTGGCGFIGGHLVDQLKANYPQAKIVVVDDLRTPGNHTIKGVKYYLSSIQDRVLLEELKTKYSFDTIFHLANTPRVRRAIEFPAETIDNNVTSTTAVCDIALEHSSHVYFAQSSSVQYDETISNPYTLSKLFADEILRLYEIEYGVQVTNMFFYSVYGPREADYGPYSTVIRRFKQRIEMNEPLEIFGTGLKERDFTHVKDVVQNMMRMVEDEMVLNGVKREVHFGRGQPKRIMDIAIAFDHSYVHKFDLPGEAQKTQCKEPYGEYNCDVLDYITAWRRYVK
jgi:nucleoside-diphosphate-sugar epimerase